MASIVSEVFSSDHLFALIILKMSEICPMNFSTVIGFMSFKLMLFIQDIMSIILYSMDTIYMDYK